MPERVRTTAGGHRPAAGKKQNRVSPKEKRRLAQLVICGLLFAGLVGIKVFLPTKMEALNTELDRMLHRNMDLEEVFSVVGEIAAGEKGGRELAQAVFGQESGITEPEPAAPGRSVCEPKEAMEFLKSCTVEEGEEPGQEETSEACAKTLACIQYSQQNLPDNVSMEQAVLGFEYCTPVTGTLTSCFGYREHPVAEDLRFHYGIDLAAEKGTQISCFADGTVTAVGESSSYGKYCIVEHSGGFETLYAHCSSICVCSDTAVRKGQELGKVGDTGLATGSHLHFELHRDGVYLNPIYYVEA